MISFEFVTPNAGHTMPRFAGPLVVAAAVAMAAPSAASAHAMEVSAKVGPPHPNQVRVDAGYEYGDPADGATVTLTDAADTEIARGKTGADGACLLPRPKAGLYKVTVDDGAGHRESVLLDVPASEGELAAAATAKRNRWLMAATGLAAIAGMTVLARKFLAAKPRPAEAPAA